MMLNKIRNSHTIKIIVVFTAVNFLTQICFPTAAFALGGGPGQSEFQSFEPVGTSEMVNLSTGDFVYNIPLLDVDGYPINLSYHSGITSDQEASWTGLGWNVNPGVLNRGMRGLPDDFNGDVVNKEINIKDKSQYGVNISPSVETFGLGIVPSFGMGIFYDNYRGLGFEFSAGIGFDAPLGLPLTANLGVNANSQEGIDISADVGLSVGLSAKGVSARMGVTVGTNYSTRSGITSINMSSSASVSVATKYGSASYGIGRSSTIPVGTQSYSPTINVPITGTASSYAFSAGGEVFGVHPGGTARGWSSTQELLTNNLSNPAYGYLYAHVGDQNLLGLKDFNREKDGVFHTTMHNLPLTNHTYDLFAANGQGIGGVYRPYRSEVGTVSDPYMVESSSDKSYSGEIGAGNLVHAGMNKNKSNFHNQSGPWIGANPAYTDLSYRGKGEAGTGLLYEPAYFKKAGELTFRDDIYYTAIGGNSPMRLDLLQSSTNITGEQTLNGGVSTMNQIRGERVQRNQNLSYLTGQEASNFALERLIKNYEYNNFSYTGDNYPLNSTTPTIDRNTGVRRPHHMSEVTVLREDGARYVYGIPAYNTKQKAVTFNMSGESPNCATGLITYDGLTATYPDNSIKNVNGLDNYYEATTTPAYAHSYMLTAIISSDYVDIMGDGPTDDDLGNYTKFNYSKMDEYNWRVPVGYEKAIFNVGYKTDPLDDKASYIYGEKEIWYLHSVETKNYVAEFELSGRRDGLGVVDEDGDVLSTSKLKKLDKITLYAKRDKIENTTAATPIKVVHFEYDYTLCKTIPNYNSGSDSENPHDEGGKLTLKKVSFTYGNSDKGQLNPYVFHYADANHDFTEEAALNPNYHLKGYDKWGTYKEQPPAGITCTTSGGVLSNDEFPYTDQTVIPVGDPLYDPDNLDKTYSDVYAAAWTLSTIELPSGGVMNVDYESDDYAYIQDKRAQQMFFVDQAYFLPIPTATQNELFQSNSLPNNYIRIILPNPITAGSAGLAKSEFINSYIGNENNLQVYFKFFVNIDNGLYDYVPGYADIDIPSITLASSSGSNVYDYAYLKFRPEYMKDDNSGDPTSPVSKAAFQMVRMNMNRILYPGSASSSFSFSTFTNIVSNFWTDLQTMVSGVNSAVRSKGVGKYFVPSKSWIRLQKPDGIKKGGGLRVSKITMSDSWNQMIASETTSEYGQTYDYKLNNGMSSGVASYEPLVGGDENPYRKPIPYEIDRKFYDNSTMFQEEPYGESLFPSPVVVYSKVTVKNLEHTDVNRNATGRTEYEFYTAKDFPLITNRTGMLQKKIKPSFLNNLFSKKHTYKFAATQGYSVELNDMHGKPKAKKSFAEGGTAPIEGVEYYYKSIGNRLNNKVTVINNENEISPDKVIGEEIDVVMDSRYQQSVTSTINKQYGLDLFLVGIWPIPAISYFKMESSTYREFKSAVSTKVIQRYGVLDKVVVFDQNSKVTTKNKLFDKATGKVLLTETINEFEAPLYAFNYPAHWFYEGMEQASKNIGAIVSIATDGNGKITSSATTTDNLTPGDELISGADKIWVSRDETTNDLYAINEVGDPIVSTNLTCKIIRSGKRNLHSLSMGDVVSHSPLIDFTGTAIALTPVLNANAIEYSDKWGVDVYNPDVLVDGDLQLCGTPNSTNLTSLESFLNKLLLANGAVTYLMSDNYDLSLIPGINPANPLFAGNSFNDLKVCFNSNSGTGSNLTSIYVEDMSTPLVGNPFPVSCLHEPAFNLHIFWQQSLPGLSFHNIQSFSNIQVSYQEDRFTIDALMTNGSTESLIGIVSKNEFVLGDDCGELIPPSEKCNTFIALGSTVNPYVKGLRGNYKANKSYAYNADRNVPAHDIRIDGEVDIVPFWGFNTTFNKWYTIYNPSHPNHSTSNAESWILNSEVTKNNPHGNQLESRDALGRYSAAQYGYNNTMSVAEVFNSKYKNFGFDGFEDYLYPKDQCLNGGHFTWSDGNISDAESHSGRYSYRVIGLNSSSNTRPLSIDICNPTNLGVPYTIECDDNNGLFEPEAGGKYVLSVWIKEPGVTPEILSYQNALVKVESNTLGVVTTLKTNKSNIIDGWQKVELIFEISNTAVVGDNFIIQLDNLSASTVYFDDIRIQPFNSTMNSYVYDPVSLRLWAELDDRNFATFYEYDEEGTLVRVKKETAQGIKTIQENRAGVKK